MMVPAAAENNLLVVDGFQFHCCQKVWLRNIIGKMLMIRLQKCKIIFPIRWSGLAGVLGCSGCGPTVGCKKAEPPAGACGAAEIWGS